MFGNMIVVINIYENFNLYVIPIISVNIIDGLLGTHVKLINFVVYIKPKKQRLFIIKLLICAFQ